MNDTENFQAAKPSPAFLIDASIYIFQAHFSPHVECLDTSGEDLSALYGFSQFLIQFLRREKPQVIAIAMDESLFCGFRHTLCGHYKSNRELPDENLERQLNACAELAEIMGLAKFSSRVYEADDIIGTLAKRLRDNPQFSSAFDHRVGIVTRDKDLAQLLNNDKEFLWDYQNNRRRYVADIEADFGVSPAQIPDYLGLVGDAVDNISGVPGVGPVKGKHLLGEYVTMEGLYANVDSVSGLKIRGAASLAGLLKEHEEQAYLCKKLATIVEDVQDNSEPFSVVPLTSLIRSEIKTDRLGDFLESEKFDKGFRDSMLNVANRINASFV
jgi:5'-3' exonuclease